MAATFITPPFFTECKDKMAYYVASDDDVGQTLKLDEGVEAVLERWLREREGDEGSLHLVFSDDASAESDGGNESRPSKRPKRDHDVNASDSFRVSQTGSPKPGPSNEPNPVNKSSPQGQSFSRLHPSPRDMLR